MPEYPQTSQDGFLYIISTSGIAEDQVKAWHRDVCCFLELLYKLLYK